jgi:hypothetical protein
MPSAIRPLAALVAVLVAALVAAAPAPARVVAATAWKVDLGAERQLRTVTVSWRARRGRYRLQTSVDGRRYRTAARVRTRRGKRVRVPFAKRAARFVRVAGRGRRAPRLVVRARAARPRRKKPPTPASPAPAPATAPSTPAPASDAAWGAGALPAPLPPSTGTRRYVSLDGSDSNPGTEARPWRSLQRALELARPGEQILVRGGTYSGTAVGPDLGGGYGNSILASPQGAPGQPITLQPYPGEQVTIVAFISLPRAAWFRMTGFIVDGAGAPPNAAGVSLGNTSYNHPHHVELSYNEIRNFRPTGDSKSMGILHHSGTDTALIGNRIHHIGSKTFYDHGIYMNRGRRVVVANNVIWDITGGYGLHIWGDFDDSWVIHNTVYGSAASGFTIGGNDDRGKPDRTVAANNLLAGHAAAANGQQGYAAMEYQPGVGNSVRRNLGWSNARSNPFNLPGSNPSNNRTADPRFVSAGSRDLRIQRGGAAQDAGEDFGLMLDADGRARDSRPDIGAFETP